MMRTPPQYLTPGERTGEATAGMGEAAARTGEAAAAALASFAAAIAAVEATKPDPSLTATARLLARTVDMCGRLQSASDGNPAQEAVRLAELVADAEDMKLKQRRHSLDQSVKVDTDTGEKSEARQRALQLQAEVEARQVDLKQDIAT